MLKKIIILALIAWAAVIFYKKFMAGTLESFYKQHKGKVDFFQQKTPSYKVSE